MTQADVVNIVVQKNLQVNLTKFTFRPNEIYK